MAGHHAALAIHPGTGYGVVVLMAGHYPDAAKLAYDAFEIMQPAIDKALADMAAELYVGQWRDEDPEAKANSSALVAISKGTLYIEKLVLEGVDALKNFGAPGRLALRSSRRRDEFRSVSSAVRNLVHCSYASAESTRAFQAITGRSTWDATRTGMVRICGVSVTTPR